MLHAHLLRRQMKAHQVAKPMAGDALGRGKNERQNSFTSSHLPFKASLLIRAVMQEVCDYLQDLEMEIRGFEFAFWHQTE
ncbi:uncharacterized [Tachysurus ichikawai]